MLKSTLHLRRLGFHGLKSYVRVCVKLFKSDPGCSQWRELSPLCAQGDVNIPQGMKYGIACNLRVKSQHHFITRLSGVPDYHIFAEDIHSEDYVQVKRNLDSHLQHSLSQPLPSALSIITVMFSLFRLQ